MVKRRNVLKGAGLGLAPGLAGCAGKIPGVVPNPEESAKPPRGWIAPAASLPPNVVRLDDEPYIAWDIEGVVAQHEAVFESSVPETFPAFEFERTLEDLWFDDADLRDVNSETGEVAGTPARYTSHRETSVSNFSAFTRSLHVSDSVADGEQLIETEYFDPDARAVLRDGEVTRKRVEREKLEMAIDSFTNGWSGVTRGPVHRGVLTDDGIQIRVSSLGDEFGVYGTTDLQYDGSISEGVTMNIEEVDTGLRINRWTHSWGFHSTLKDIRPSWLDPE